MLSLRWNGVFVFVCDPEITTAVIRSMPTGISTSAIKGAPVNPDTDLLS